MRGHCALREGASSEGRFLRYEIEVCDMGSPPKTKILNALRFLNGKQLNTIIRRNRWCSDIQQVGPDNETKRERIRDRAETHLIENAENDWESFLDYLRDDLIEGGYRKTADRIDRCIRQTNIRPLNQLEQLEEQGPVVKRKKELWYSAQLYGALDREFNAPNTPFKGHYPVQHLVAREHDKWGLFVDILVRNERTGAEYLIEVKRADNITNIDEIEDQLKRYDAIFTDRERTYLVILYNRLRELESFADGEADEDKISGRIDRGLSVDSVDTLLLEIDPAP